MRILFDHNVDRRFRRHLHPVHVVQTTREMGWERFENGVLLRAAADGAFDVFLSVDKNIEHEQNLLTLPLPVVILDSISNALPSLVPLAPHVLELLKSPLDRALYIIAPSGSTLRLTKPRS